MKEEEEVKRKVKRKPSYPASFWYRQLYRSKIEIFIAEANNKMIISTSIALYFNVILL